MVGKAYDLPSDPENSDLNEDSDYDQSTDSDSNEGDDRKQDEIVKETSDWSQNVSMFSTEHDFEKLPTINIFSVEKKNIEKYFFHQIFRESYMQTVADETNKYSRQKNEKLTN